MRKFMFSTMLICFTTLPLWAQDLDPAPAVERPQRIFKIGAGFLTLQKPYKGVDQDCYGIPFIFYRDQKLTIFGPMASYSFFGSEDRWALQGLARIRTEGYDNDDSRYLNGMSDRDRTLELGLRWMQNLDVAILSFDFTHDVLDEHRGYEFKFALRKPFRNVWDIEPLTLTPVAGLNWRSKQLNDYYYGVRSSEAAAGRPVYNAGGGITYLTGLQIDYKLSEKWSLLGMVNVEWMGSEISDSPIVEDHYSVSCLLGAMVEF